MTLITKECIYKWANIVKSHPTVLKDTISIGPTGHRSNRLHQMLQTTPSTTTGTAADPVPFPNSLYTPWNQGFHFLFNNQLNLKLGSDGYDNYQAPINHQGEQLYLRRLWARGEIQFIDTPKINTNLTCTESIKSVRMIEEDTFVTIVRNFQESETGKELLIENRTLAYTNQLYNPANNRCKVLEGEISSAKDMCISYVDLLKYSMLTFNLHKIHFDPKYCRSIEDLPTTIVQGPLQVTLLLYWFGINYPDLKVSNFKYRTYEPCFVHEEICLNIAKEKDNEFVLSIFNKETKRVYIDGSLTTSV